MWASCKQDRVVLRTKGKLKMAHYIISTASQPMTYCVYEQSKSNNPKVIRRIRINGYANVRDPNGGRNVVMPRCAITEISDEDWAYLSKNSAFKYHQEKGFMRHSPVYSDKVVDEGMTKRDRSAMINDWEFAEGRDERFSPIDGAGSSHATCGMGDNVKGVKGFQFVDE